MQIEKKNENRIPHRLTQSVDSDEKDKVIACMLRKIRTCFFLQIKPNHVFVFHELEQRPWTTYNTTQPSLQRSSASAASLFFVRKSKNSCSCILITIVKIH